MLKNKTEISQKIMGEINLGQKLKELRLKNNLTLQELAISSGLSTALLSKVENDIITPPIPTLWKIAKTLNINIGFFFREDSEEAKDYVITKHNKRKIVYREGSKHGYVYESLAYGKKNVIMEPFVVTLTQENRRGGELFSHEGEELVYVIEGSVEFILEDKSFVLEKGDSVYFNSYLKHRLAAAKGDSAKTLQVIYYAES